MPGDVIFDGVQHRTPHVETASDGRGLLDDTLAEGADWVRAGETTLGTIELLLKRPARVDELCRQPAWQREFFQRFLLIGVGSYLIYSLVMLLVINLAPAPPHLRGLMALVPAASWSDGSGLGLVAGYTLGIVLAACVCLPSFYFHSLLAGVRMSWLEITSLVAKGTAANAILLLGILPIYVAVALGMVVFQAPAASLQPVLVIGLALPFFAGLWGLRAIYLGIVSLSNGMPQEWQCRRSCFLRRLTLSWAAVYTAVAPVMIYRLWQFVSEACRFA